jgi:hypothetical protein
MKWTAAELLPDPMPEPCVADAPPTAVVTLGDGAIALGPGAISLAELAARPVKKFNWRIQGLVADDNYGNVIAPPKAGKTYLSLQMAMALDTGQDFLGMATQKSRVLIVALEDGEERIKRRIAELGWQPQQAVLRTAMPFLDGENGGPGPGLAQLREWIVKEHYDVVFIDTLVASLSGRVSENDNSQMGAVLNPVAALAHELKTAIFIIHHTGKAKNGEQWADPRGASAIRAAYDVGLYIVTEPGAKEGFLRVESRDTENRELPIRFRKDGVGWELAPAPAERPKTHPGGLVVQALRDFGDGQTTEDIAELIKMSRQNAARQLHKAENMGLVRRERQQGTGGRPVVVWYLADEGVEEKGAEPAGG